MDGYDSMNKNIFSHGGIGSTTLASLFFMLRRLFGGSSGERKNTDVFYRIGSVARPCNSNLTYRVAGKSDAAPRALTGLLLAQVLSAQSLLQQIPWIPSGVFEGICWCAR